MPIVKVDRKGRITLPRNVAQQFKIRHGQSLILKPVKDAIVIRHVEPSSKHATQHDSLTWLLHHPLKTPIKDLKKKLDKIEDEMWLP